MCNEIPSVQNKNYLPANTIPPLLAAPKTDFLHPSAPSSEPRTMLDPIIM